MHIRQIGVLVVALALTACGDTDSGPVFAQAGGTTAQDIALRNAMTTAGVTSLDAAATETADMVELGRLLFFDKELSGNRNISCATCHHPAAGTGDALPLPIGQGGIGLAENRSVGTASIIPRNAPPVFHLGAGTAHTMFWDGRVSIEAGTGILNTPESGLNGVTPALPTYTAQLNTALAAQAMFPVTSGEEMRGHGNENELAAAPTNVAVWEAIMVRLVGSNNGAVGGFAEYRTLFQAAFPSVSNFDDFTFAHAARAMAAFESDAWSQVTSRCDQYLGGDNTALSASEKRGALLFCEKANCAACHSGPHFSDFGMHAIAAPQVGPGKDAPLEDRGRAVATGLVSDNYKFRTPPLRNVALTGPWTHAGAYTTLEGVVRHHLDPTSGLLAYDATQLPALFESMVDTDGARNAARLAAVSPLLSQAVLSNAEVADLMAFLYAMTSPEALNLLQDVPDSVPSGLPVID